MNETLDPLSSSGSPSRNCPNVIFKRIRNMCGSNGNPRSDIGEGYVEFGDLRASRGVQKVGTFAGVFCPVVLSMFSAIIFIRMGYIVGNAGLYISLTQFGLAYTIVLFTVLSICAISTNGAVEGGGVYFMISRTLGPEFGGAIGTLFFFANIASCALCLSACTEGLVENFGPSGYLIDHLKSGGLPVGPWWLFLYRSMLNAAAVAISLAGASLFARTSLAIFIVVFVCILSTFLSFVISEPATLRIPTTNTIVQNATNPAFGNYTGFSRETLFSNLHSNYSRDYSTVNGDFTDFASIFGVLFTGLTGVMAGANMSGELKNPGRSIPRGTLSALAFTSLCYVGLVVMTAATCSRFLLQNNYVYMLPINIFPPFVAVGMLTATFSAGLSNMIGASRVLEALAKDNIYGMLLKWASPRSHNPVAAVLLSWFLVQLALTIRSLNVIAQVVSVLFMTSYLAVNLACLGLDLASAPNFRPTFRHFSSVTSACGLLGCMAIMLALRPVHTAAVALAALCLVMALHLLSPAANDARWGSLTQALIFHQVRKYLLLLDPRREHVKFWRPQMLLLVGSPRQSCPLIDFVNDQKKGGLYIIGHVRIGRLGDSGDPLASDRKYWLSLIDHLQVKAFVELCLSESIRDGAAQLTRLSGLGAMKPDTVLIGFRDETVPVDFFSSSESPYKTDIFDDPLSETVFPLRANDTDRPSANEYVNILSDVLTVDKNLCVCRHFQKLVMSDISKKSTLIKYIDVYLPEWCNPTTADPFSLKSLFALQLAAVVRSSRDWKHLKLRVWHAICHHTPLFLQSGNTTTSLSESLIETEMMSSPTQDPTERMKQLLKLLRISASVHEIENWSSAEDLRWTNRTGDSYDEFSYNQIPFNYLKRCNELIRRTSGDETAVTFILLPPPPRQTKHRARKYSRPTNFDAENLESMTYVRNDTPDECLTYLKVLEKLTDDLGPTILVHGLKSVTSTKL